MRFIRDRLNVNFEKDGKTKVLPIGQFQALEPDFESDLTYPREDWTPQEHFYVSEAGETIAIAGLDRAVYVERAFAEVYDPPNWHQFRIGMLSSASFNAWSEQLPASLRENLKLAAIAGNAEILQSLCEAAIEQVPPSAEALQEWQNLSDTNRIGLSLGLSTTPPTRGWGLRF